MQAAKAAQTGRAAPSPFAAHDLLEIELAMNILRDSAADPGTRTLGVVAGLWLVASGFLWPHTVAFEIVAWVIGGLLVVASLGPSPVPSMMTILGIALAVATLVLPDASRVTLGSNLAVAIVAFVGGLIPVGTHRHELRVSEPSRQPHSARP